MIIITLDASDLFFFKLTGHLFQIFWIIGHFYPNIKSFYRGTTSLLGHIPVGWNQSTAPLSSDSGLETEHGPAGFDRQTSIKQVLLWKSVRLLECLINIIRLFTFIGKIDEHHM